MGRVLIACASADAAMAARVARALTETGEDVEIRRKAPALKPEKDAFDDAVRLVFLWSRAMAGDAAMLREAIAAGDRLTVVRLDATRLPKPLRGAHAVALSAARPQRGLAALAAAPAASATTVRKVPPSAPKPRRERDHNSGRWSALVMLVMLVSGVAWAAYGYIYGKPPVDLQAVIAGLRV